jgi:MFS family permease
MVTEKPQRYRWVIFGLLVVTAIVVTMVMSDLSPISQILIEDLRIDPVAWGTLLGVHALAAAVVSAAISPVLGKIGLPNVGRISIWALTIASLVAGIASGYVDLFISRILVGISWGLWFPIMTGMTMLWFPPRERTGIMTSNWLWSYIGGFVIAYTLVPLTDMCGGWRGAYWTLALLMLVVAIAFTILIRAPKVERSQLNEKKESTETRMPKVSWGDVLKLRITWLLVCIWFGGWWVAGALGWLPAYFVQQHGMDVATAAVTVGNFSLLGLIFTPTCGLLSNYFGKRRPFTVPNQLVAILGLYLAIAFSDPTMILLGIILTSYGLTGWTPALWSIPMEIPVPGWTPIHAGALAGILTSLGLIGMFIAPIAIGALIPYLGLMGSMLICAVGVQAFTFVCMALVPESGPGRK